jgi:hypothetical protein
VGRDIRPSTAATRAVASAKEVEGVATSARGRGKSAKDARPAKEQGWCRQSKNVLAMDLSSKVAFAVKIPAKIDLFTNCSTN